MNELHLNHEFTLLSIYNITQYSLLVLFKANQFLFPLEKPEPDLLPPEVGRENSQKIYH